MIARLPDIKSFCTSTTTRADLGFTICNIMGGYMMSVRDLACTLVIQPFQQ